MSKDAVAPRNFHPEGEQELVVLLSLPPLPKRVRNRVEVECFFLFFLRIPNERLTMPRQYNELFLVFKFRGGEQHGSDAESSELCQHGRVCSRLSLLYPSLPIACMSKKM